MNSFITQTKSTSRQELESKLQISSEFLEIVGEKSIGIDQIRLVKKFTKSRPAKKTTKLILITDAHKLTTEAQNAFLKTLEEPPEFIYFVLQTNNPNLLLPTIRSRCSALFLKNTSTAPNTNQNSTNIFKQLVDKKHNRDELLIELEKFCSALRSEVKANPNMSRLFNLKLVLYIRKLVDQNVNLDLAKDYLRTNYKH